MTSTQSDNFAKSITKDLTEDQKTLLESHFVKQRNKKNFFKVMKFSVAAGCAVGAFIGIVAFGKSIGDSFSN